MWSPPSPLHFFSSNMPQWNTCTIQEGWPILALHQTVRTYRADPGFSLGGGGGRKRLCARSHITRCAEPNSLSAGVGPLKGPGSCRVVLMLALSCYLSLIFKHSDKKNWEKKTETHSWSNFRRVRACCAPGSATDLVIERVRKHSFPKWHVLNGCIQWIWNYVLSGWRKWEQYTL